MEKQNFVANEYPLDAGENINECLRKRNKLNEEISSDEFIKMKNRAPFEFINAIHICEMLKQFETGDDDSVYKFSSAMEAAMIYTNIVSLHKNKDDILNDAKKLIEVYKMVEEVNEMSRLPYLAKSVQITFRNEEIFDLAVECMSVVPEYDKLMTKKFRDMFTVSCLKSLPKEEIDKLVVGGIIKSVHIDNIPAYGDKQYTANYKHLLSMFNKELSLTRSTVEKVKGVTFEDQVGKSRQDILKEILQVRKNGKEIELEAFSYIFTKDGESEPAIMLKWNGRNIGNLSKELAEEIFKNLTNKIKVSFLQVTGQELGNLGMEVKVDIYELKDKSVSKDLSK